MVRTLVVLMLGLLLVDSAIAACKAIPRGAKYGIEWSVYDAEGNLVGFGTGQNSYPAGANSSGNASGTGLGTGTWLDGTTTGEFGWTITVTGFNRNTCTGNVEVRLDGTLFHNGRFVSSENGTHSDYVGVFVDPNLVRGATVIRVRDRLQ